MLLVNAAGSSPEDPILAGLTAKFVFAASTMDVSEIVGVWLDQTSGVPGTNSILSSISPSTSTFLAGTNAMYNDVSDRLNIGATGGLSAGDPLYLSHEGISPGIYIIESIPEVGYVTLQDDPFAGGGNKNNIAFQVGWGYTETIGTSPILATAEGTQNWFKAEVKDSNGATAQAEDSFYARTAPNGAAFIALDGLAYNSNPVVGDTSLTLSILPNWQSKGGVSHVELVAHSIYGVNDFTFGGGGSTERSLSQAEDQGIVATPGDGPKHARLLLRTLPGGQAMGIDLTVILDTTGPSITMRAFGA